MSPSYQSSIDEEFNEYINREEIDSRILEVGAQWPENAVYHDFVDMINNGNFSDNRTGLTDEEITWLYHDIQDATGYSIRYYGVEGYDKQIFNIFAFLSDKSLVMLGAPEDDFVEVLYSGKEYNEDRRTIKRTITNEPLKDYLDMPDEEKMFISIESTPTAYKNTYFDTMFYKTYVGPFETDQQTGSRKEYQWQLPCIDMKHFYAEYISDMSKYQYYSTGKSAVVIAKYYEGAMIDGSVWFNGTKMDCSLFVLKNLTYYEGGDQPITHDSFEYVASGDNFSLLAGAGAYIQIAKDVGDISFNLRTINFTGEPGSEYAPISEEDAMRQDGSNYERYLNISIEPGSIKGVLYNDINDNGVYNLSIDEPLEDMDIKITEIKSIQDDNINQIGKEISVKTNETGSYSVSGLEPGVYRIRAYNKEGYVVNLIDASVYEGENTVDIINPKLGGMEGTVYYDDNLDGNYSSGEAQGDVDLKLTYYEYGDNGALVNSIETVNITVGSDGSYSFTDLVPGRSYVLEAKKSSKYELIEAVTIVANETKKYNISLDLSSKTLNGEAKYNGQGIEGVTITFEPDEDVSKNTAEQTQVVTDESGTYSIELIPGNYNISIEKEVTQGTTQTLVYSAPDSKIKINITDDTKTEDFELTKHTVTLTGAVTYDSIGRENVSVIFAPDNTSLGINSAQAYTENDGLYTVELSVIEGVNITYTIYAEGSNFTGNEDTYTGSGEKKASFDDIKDGLTEDIVLTLSLIHI